MDKILDANPSKSEVIGRCGGDGKTNDHARPIQSNTHKKDNRAEYSKLYNIPFTVLLV